MSGEMHFVHVVDEDLDWLKSYVMVLNETIRQTLEAHRRRKENPNSHAVRALEKDRDRAERIIKRLEPTVTYTTFP
jgi:hypothetical protein